MNQDLSVPGHPEVLVVGDMAAVKTKEGKPVPGVAPAAMQMGEHAGKNVLRQLQGKTPEPFWYFDKGSLATIGRNAGIADLKGLRFSGTPAWLAWAFIQPLLPRRFPQPHDGFLPMGLGLLHVRPRRACHRGAPAGAAEARRIGRRAFALPTGTEVVQTSSVPRLRKLLLLACMLWPLIGH